MTMKTAELKRIVEITMTPDVLVVGAGPAGLCAAVAAARTGAQTLLVERYGCAGGMATMGLVGPFMTCYESSGEVQVIRGLFEEIVERLIEKGGAIHPSKVPTKSAFTSYIGPGHLHVTPFDPEKLKLVADEMLEGAGVKVMYHTDFLALDAENGRIETVYLHTKGGIVAVQPKIVVDASGDGDVAAAAGVSFHLGNEAGDKIQPASTFFRIGNVDLKKVDADIEANKDNFYRKDGVNYRSFHWRVAEARANGDWDLDRVSIGMFRGVAEDEWSINTSRIMNVNGTDSESLTRGEMEGRRQVDIIFNFLKKYVPGCENAKLLSVAPTLGIRETRHIHGRKTLTVDDCLEGRVPDDSVAVCANSVDVHGKFGPRSNEYIPLADGVYYGIPYGTFLPLGVDNLMVAGRCLSATSEAAGAVRVMPPCMAMGEAVGTAAGLCVGEGVLPYELSVKTLREKLLANNVFLGN